MSYKNENMKMIELHENGLDIQFRIRGRVFPSVSCH